MGGPHRYLLTGTEQLSPECLTAFRRNPETLRLNQSPISTETRAVRPSHHSMEALCTEVWPDGSATLIVHKLYLSDKCETSGCTH